MRGRGSRGQGVKAARSRRSKHLGMLGLVLSLLVPGIDAQEPLAFEVASVKAAAPGTDMMSMRNQPGQFGAGNLPLRMVITQAFNLQGYQIIGGPGWIESDRWDITAKMPDGMSTPDQRREMLRTLLADRFRLKTHTETRELPIYALTVARSDGRLGPDLRKPSIDCAAFRAERAAAAKAAGPSAGQLVVMSSQGPMLQCGVSMLGAPGGGVNFKAQGMTMESFSRLIQGYVDRPVFDRTGLKEEFEIDISFTPERGGPMRADAGASDLPSIFTAVQEHLGLKLDAARGPLEVLVIDSVERPTEN